MDTMLAEELMRAEGLMIAEQDEEARDLLLHLAEDAEEYLEQTGDDLFLLIRYDPAAGALELDATQGGRGFGLKGDMALSVEDSLLVNISADEQQFDLMDLGVGKLLELRGELAIVALKFAHFAGGTGIGGLLK